MHTGELDGEEAVALAEFIIKSFGGKGQDARKEAEALIKATCVTCDM